MFATCNTPLPCTPDRSRHRTDDASAEPSPVRREP